MLQLINDDKLTLENGKALQVHINYRKESKGYFTPLMNAIELKRETAIRILLELGADPTIQVKRDRPGSSYYGGGYYYRDYRRDYRGYTYDDGYNGRDTLDSFVVAKFQGINLPGILEEVRKAAESAKAESAKLVMEEV